MFNLLDYEIGTVDWSTLRTLTPQMASRVPLAIRALVAAGSEDEANAAYWQLDNQVVVQGQLFEASARLVPVLFAALLAQLAPAARLRVLDLLVDLLRRSG